MSIAIVPALGAVQEYQIDAPPAFPAWFGSPVSLVAPTLEPMAVPARPESGGAEAKASVPAHVVAPFVTRTDHPSAVAARTSMLTPLAASVKDSPGSHMAPASLGSPFRVPSTTWAGSSRVVRTSWITMASPGMRPLS